jgi:fibronectin-binding autotransporter adhesin
MTRLFNLTLRTASLAILLAYVGPAVAQPLAVTNADFELPAVAAGGNVRFNIVIPGWTLLQGINTTAGLQDFTTGADWLPGTFTAGVNENALFMQGAAYASLPQIVSQTLSDTLQANTSYTLSVDVADRPAILPTSVDLDGGYVLQLWAGGTMLAQAKGIAPTNPATGGKFTNISVSFDTLNDSLPAGVSLGSTLEIRLSNEAFNQNAARQVNMDNVAVNAAPAVLTNQWNAAGGGNWTTAGNWSTATVPNGAADVARLHGKIDGPSTVTVDGNITLDTLDLNNVSNSYTIAGDGSHGLTLAGSATVNVVGAHTISAPIAGAMGLNKIGTGTLTLSGTNTYTGPTSINGGTLIVSNLADGLSNSSIGSSNSDAANLVLDNAATLRYVGAADASTDRLFTLGTFRSTFDSSGAGAVNFTNTGAAAFMGSDARMVELTGSNTGPNTMAPVIGDGPGGSTLLVKNGPGTWVLTGANSYSGTTTINNGALRITDASGLGANTGIVTTLGSTGSGGALELSGGISVVDKTLNMQGRQGPAAANAALRNVSGDNTWTGPIAAQSGGAYLNIESLSGKLTITGNLTMTGLSVFRSWRLAGDGDGEISGSIIKSAVAGADTPIVKDGAGTWTLSGGDGNTFSGPTLIRGGTLKVFDTVPDAGEIRSGNIILLPGTTLDTSHFSNYSLQPAQVLNGSGTVNAGTNTLTMFDDNTINPGNTMATMYALRIGANSPNTPSVGVGTLAITGNFSIQNVFAAPVGGLNYDLAGTTTVGGGVNDLITVSGDLSIDSSTGAVPVGLNYINDAVAVGSYRLINYGGTLTGSAASFQIVNPTRGMSISAGGGQVNVVKDATPAANLKWVGDGILNNWDTNVTANWNNGASADTFFALDNVTIDDTGDNTAPVNLVGLTTPASITVNNTAKNFTFGGTGKISSATGITKTGSGTLIIANTGGNNYTGATTINAGAIQTSAANVLSKNSAVAIADVAGATLDLNGTSQSIAGLSGGGATGGEVKFGATAGTTLTVIQATNTTYAGAISGTGAIFKDGAGSLTLTGASTYTGATTIFDGVVRITNNDALGTAAGNTVIPGDITTTETSPLVASRLELTGDITVPEPLSLGGRGIIDVHGNLAPHVVNVGGNNTLAGTITFTAEAIPSAPTIVYGADYTLQSDAGKLTVAGNITNPVTGAVRTLNLLGAASGEVSGIISNGAAPSTLALAKDGSGTWTLSGANTYRGATDVKGGTLLVNSATGTGLTTVYAGATLGGTGAVAGDLMVNPGGTVAPGASVGTLAVAGNATLNGTLSAEVSGATIDLLNVTGGLTLGAGSALHIQGALSDATTFVLATFNPGTLAGTFADATDATTHGYNVVYENSQITLDELDGDANHDGVVNIFDINLVSANWDPTGPVGAFAPGNINHDTTVNIFDINLISANWNNMATNGGAAHAQAVPEPSSIALVSLGLLGFVIWSRSGRSRKAK